MIVVTGATGFTGSYVCALLAERGLPFRAVIRNPAKGEFLKRLGAETSIATFEDLPALTGAMKGCQVLLNVASLGFGHAENFIAAAKEAGIRRAVFVSTTALFTKLPARTKLVRLAAEDSIMASGLDWTILRPTMIYGSAADRNIYRLLRLLKRFPIMPVPGDGQRLQQPVHVSDVAKAVVDAAFAKMTVGRAYNIPGREPLTFDALIDYASAALHRRVWKVHFPIQPVIAAFRLYERLVPRPFIKVEQLLRLTEDKAFDYAEATRDFGYRPLSFQMGVERMVRELRAQGMI